MNRPTYLHEMSDGRLIEYRRRPSPPGILRLEGRVLRRDGTPFDDQWYETTAREFIVLQLSGSDILDLLAEAPC